MAQKVALPVSGDQPKIHAFLARSGVASRRQAEELVRTQKVTVNGQTAEIGQRVNPLTDTIEVNGKKISRTQPTIRTFLIYKPKGIVSTTKDELGRTTVLDFLRENVSHPETLPRLYPVGRLDQDSEGLMILTNDGRLTQEYTHPSFQTPKTYRVTVLGQPTAKAVAHLERGVKLKEGYTAPAVVHVETQEPDQTILTIQIHEGRYHQVKRMFLRVGYEVTRLIRIQLGPYSLDNLEKNSVKEISSS